MIKNFRFHYLLGCILSIAILLQLSGCCKWMPFIACKQSNIIYINWSSSPDSNDGHSVQVRFLLLENKTAFETCPAKAIFDQKSDSANFAKLQVRNINNRDDMFDIFAGSEREGQFTRDVHNVGKIDDKRVLYLAIIANFADPKDASSARLIVPLNGKNFPISFNLRIERNSISGKFVG